jgi:short-subunit dehydrogenase
MPPSSYPGSKRAVLGLGKALHREVRLVRLDGIRAATVLPWADELPSA